jgi:hypothetical protein
MGVSHFRQDFKGPSRGGQQKKAPKSVFCLTLRKKTNTIDVARIWLRLRPQGA